MKTSFTVKPFRLNLFQILLLIILGINLIALTLSANSTSHGASRDDEVFSSIKNTAQSLALVQRETLVYTIKFTQWGAGDIPRSEVEVARANLEKRLSGLIYKAAPSGQYLSSLYFETLKDSDRILAAAKLGYLAKSDSLAIQGESKKLISTMVNFSRTFAFTYRAQLDQLLEISAKDRRHKAEVNLYLRLLFILLLLVFIFFHVYALNKHHRVVNKTLEAQLTSLNVALAGLKESGSLVEKLELLDERKNNFISTINHELRTPLTSIIGYTTLLRKNVDTTISAQGEEILNVIERNSETLLNLVEEILTLSSLESDPSMLAKEGVDVETIIRECILALTPVEGVSKIPYIVDVQGDIDTVIQGNKNQISRALSNLLSNALKFSHEGAKIKIDVSERYDERFNRFVRVAITDHGMGIPESEIGEVFSSFYRTSNALNNGIPGSGLGLAITKRIIELHQGSIGVVSKVGIGSTFTLELPTYVSELEKMIKERKGGVLERAISAIESCSVMDLPETCHEMIGALGFYELGFLGDEIELFSDWLKMHEVPDESELSSRRVELLEKLKNHLETIDNLGVS